MLAKAVATECKTTFFNISASTLVSKWRGDSEKLVRCLFEVARYYAPSTIFFDEIDSILNSRGGEGSEHEASRRMKTELLMQMDGLRSRDNSNKDQNVFVMAASNLPWDLDVAVLRRLEKRVLVGLPEQLAREHMLRQNLKGRVDESTIDFEQIALITEGYSGADMELLCREAAMRPVRRLMAKLSEIALPPPAAGGSGGARQQRGAGGGGFRPAVTEPAVNVESLLRADPVSVDDIAQACTTTKKSSDGSMAKYDAWQLEYGSV
jgi:katanin p60 ATPase-containing subunit A1